MPVNMRRRNTIIVISISRIFARNRKFLMEQGGMHVKLIIDYHSDMHVT